MNVKRLLIIAVVILASLNAFTWAFSVDDSRVIALWRLHQTDTEIIAIKDELLHIMAVPLAFPGCGNTLKPCYVYGNPGGLVFVFEEAGRAFLNNDRKELVIDGSCYSSCVIAADIARPNVCILPGAKFLFHRGNDEHVISAKSLDLIDWVSNHGGFPSYA